jgi:hypothetical protein
LDYAETYSYQGNILTEILYSRLRELPYWENILDLYLFIGIAT